MIGQRKEIEIEIGKGNRNRPRIEAVVSSIQYFLAASRLLFSSAYFTTTCLNLKS